jgi:hypothetical protein
MSLAEILQYGYYTDKKEGKEGIGLIPTFHNMEDVSTGIIG